MSITSRKHSAGFVMVVAVFVIVVLAALGGYMVSLSTGQQKRHALDIVATRAMLAATSGLDWGVYQAVKKSTTYCAAGSASHTLTESILPGLAGFRVDVSCTSQQFTEGSSTYRVYRLAAVACNADGACSSPSGPSYVERRFTATVVQ